MDRSGSTPSEVHGNGRASGRGDAQDELTLARLVEALLRYRWLVAAITVVFTLAGLAYALLARPVYQADMMIQLDDGAASSSTWSLLGDATSLFDMKSSTGAETQIIGSRLVVERAVESLRLHVGAEPRLTLAPESWLARWRGQPEDALEVSRFDVPHEFEGEKFVLTMQPGQSWRLEGAGLDAPIEGRIGVERTLAMPSGELRLNVAACACRPGAAFDLVRYSLQTTVANVRKRLNVQEKTRQSGVLTVTLTGPEPGPLQGLLHEIGEQYVRQNVERKSAEAAQSLTFLDRQLPGLKQQLEQAQSRYSSMTARNGVVDLTEEARIALKAAAETQTQMLWLTQKRQDLATRFTNEHPSLMAIDRQLDVVRQKQQDMDKVVRGMPELQRQTTQLALEVRVATELYTSLLRSAQQLELMKAGRVASARVVDTAEVTEDPVAPNRLFALLAAMLCGMIAGAGVAFTMDWLAGGVSAPDDIEQGLGISVLGVVPQSVAQLRLAARRGRDSGELRLLSSVAKSDPAVESLRSLHTALRLSSMSRERNVLLVTGCEQEAGKTFVCSNLAAVLAAGGQKVLLIDGDMRRGTVHHVFGRATTPGLTDALARNAGWPDIVQRDVVPGLDVIFQGASHPHVGELLANANLAEFITDVRKHYDAVLIDTPPVLAVADATLMARYADLVLVVARAGQSRLADLDAACKRLRMCGVTAAGIVLNGLIPRSGRFGYRYGQDYRDAGSLPAGRGATLRRWWQQRRHGGSDA